MIVFVFTLGTLSIALALIGRAVLLRPRHWRAQAAASVIAALVSVIANPVGRFILLAGAAESARSEMLWSAHEAEIVGKPQRSLVERYGRPFKIVKDGEIEHWWYRPGRWYLVHEDYVGFAIENGRVTQAYIQVD